MGMQILFHNIKSKPKLFKSHHVTSFCSYNFIIAGYYFVYYNVGTYPLYVPTYIYVEFRCLILDIIIKFHNVNKFQHL